jgi:hypothetical protein
VVSIHVLSGPGSSVSIATGHGLEGPGIESIAGSLPTEAVGFFLLEKSTACLPSEGK